MKTRVISFPSRTAFKIVPSNEQIGEGRRIYQEHKDEIQASPSIELAYWVDKRTLIVFNNEITSFWEVTNA